MSALTLGCCLGVAFVVDDIHKGCNLAFRYPAPQSDSHVSAFHRLSSALVAKLFRPKNVLCNQTFQLVIDDLRFISHPVTINIPTSNTSSSIPPTNSGSVSGRRDTSMFNVIFALDDTKLDGEGLVSSATTSSTANGRREKKVNAFAQVAAQLAHAFLHEENRVGFVTSEVRELLHLRDEIAQNERQLAHSMESGTLDKDTQEIDVDPQTLIDVALGKSILANDLKAVYHGLEEDGSVHVVLNRWVQLSLTLYDTNTFHITNMRPYHTLLLLQENEKLLESLPADSSPQLRLIIEAHNPLRDFQELMLETGIPLKQLFRLAAHLVYWGVARVIDAVTMHNVYHVQPDANIHNQSALAQEFRRKFSSAELCEVLSTFTGMSPISNHMNTLTQHRKVEYIHTLIWLLQHEFISQLHRYVYLMIPQENSNGQSSRVTPPAIPSPAQLSPALQSMYSPSEANMEKEYLAQLARKANTPTPVVDLFQRLEPYFHGQHHLVEIMWRENVTRRQLTMFLSWVSKCELLQSPPDAHVLKGFNEECQRGISSMVVGFLNSMPNETQSNAQDGTPLPPPPSPMAVLLTPTHVRWAMEPLGHSFALGMDDSDVILGTIRIYEQWLGLSATDSRPKCMQHQEQEFIRDLLGHMSLLFEEREVHRTNPELVLKHAKLCQIVLELFSILGRKRASQLTPATWEHFLRLLLGITDCVLHGSKHTLAQSLCAQLFRVILEQFILSLPIMGVKGELWNMLLKFCRRWLHCKAIIEQWNTLSLALTQQLLERIHISSKRNVSIVWNERHTTLFELESPLLAYAWYRVMRVIGHPSLFVDPEVYLAAITSIHQIARVLSFAKPSSADTTPVPQLPDVNTILRLLGPWLFDASLNRTQNPRFALCRAEAIRCLGGLLCNHGIGRTKQISWPFTIRALMAIQKALMDKDEVLVAAAVVSCSRIFGTHGTHTLRGVGVLAGSFHDAIDRVLMLSVGKAHPRKETQPTSPRKRSSLTSDGDTTVHAIGGVPTTTLRRACIEACSSLLTIHSHYPLAITKQVEKNLISPELEGVPGIYSSLPRFQSSNVVTQLINFLKTEQDPTNQQMAMWQLTIAVQKEALFWSMGLASTRNSQVPTTIMTICSFVTKLPSRWKPAVLFTALECLRYLTIVSEHLYKHVFSSCVYLISCVCEFMAMNAQILRSTRTPPPFLDQLIASATSCLLEWVVTTPQLLSKAQIMVKVIATTVDAADFRMDFAPMEPHADDATRQSAQHLLEYLMKHHALGNVDCKQSYDERTVYFTWNERTILSILETEECVYLTVRDSSGCYHWQSKPQYFPTKLGQIHSASSGNHSTPSRALPSESQHEKQNTNGATLNDPLLRSLRKNSTNLTSWSTDMWEGNDGGKHVESSGKRHEHQVKLFLSLLTNQSNAFRENSTAAFVKTKPLDAPLTAPTTTHQARRMLSQLGYISVASWGSLFRLHPSPKLIQDLHALDRLPTRETYEIGIAYASNQPSCGGYDVIDIVAGSSTDCSPAYTAFLATMGSTVDVNSYGGFLGYMQRREGQNALVYSQHNYEVAFYVPTLAADHVTVLEKAEVLIVWNECQQNYRPGTALWSSAYKLPHPKSSVYIIIDPLDDGLFCVRVSVDGSAFECNLSVKGQDGDNTFSGRVLGPLQDGMVVGSEWLGPLIRQTALNAVHVHRLYLRYKHSLGLSSQSPIRPQEKRTKLISTIVKQHMDPVLPGEFYSSLFEAH